MFSDPFEALVDDGSGLTANKSWARISSDGQSTVYRNIADQDPGEIRSLKISHQVVGKGSSTRDRRLVRIEVHPVVDTVEDPTVVAAVYLVADVPRGKGYTADQLRECFQQLSGMIRGKGSAASGDSTPDATVFLDRFMLGEA